MGEQTGQRFDSDGTHPIFVVYNHELSADEVRQKLQETIPIVEEWLYAKAPKGVFSTFLKLQLAWIFLRQPLVLHGKMYFFPFFPIVDEIGHLEAGGSKSRTRRESPFVHGPLSGFMHKHFYWAGAVAKNVLQEITHKKHGDILINRDFKPASERATGQRWGEGHFNDEAIRIFSHIMTIGAIEERSGHNKQSAISRLTGDWIVYYPHADGNIYLTLAAHAEEEDLASVAIRIFETSYEFPCVADKLRENGCSFSVGAV